MTDIEWGDPIEVNGVRPEWLRDGDRCLVSTKYSGDNWYDETEPNMGWGVILSIRLPANHPYYTATSRGFTYWPGGESAPDDWDGGEVLFDDGVEQSFVARWLHWQTPYARNIIGYRKRTEQPAPAIAPELVERMVALVRELGKHYEGAFYNSIPWVVETKAILAELNPDPDLTLAKSIVGDAEAIALAIKAARENAK